jgi:hypothetical protein
MIEVSDGDGTRSLCAGALFLCTLISSALAWAGPWTKSAGEIYVQTSEQIYSASGYRNANGQLITDVNYTGYTTSLYMELGLLDGIQIQGYLPYTVAINSFEDDHQFMKGGLADMNLGVQWKPVPTWLFSVRNLTKVPLYDLARYKGENTERFPALGDGQIDSTLWLSYGHTTRDSPLYLVGELGLRLRSQIFTGEAPADGRSFANTVPFVFQLGSKFSSDLLTILELSGAVATNDDPYTSSTLEVGQTIFAPFVDDFAVVASISQTVLAKNASKGLSLSLGLAYSP